MHITIIQPLRIFGIWPRFCGVPGMSLLLLALTLQFGSSCVYMRSVVVDSSPCGEEASPMRAPRRSTFGRSCQAGLPPSVRLRFLSSGSVCAGTDLFERVRLDEDRPGGPAVDLPEWAGIRRLCRRGPGVQAPRRRWWLPKVALSAERSLRLSPDGSEYSNATTFWLTLSFPFPSGDRATSTPEHGRMDELCDAARRLNLALVTVDDPGVRARAGLQLLAWRDELEMLFTF